VSIVCPMFAYTISLLLPVLTCSVDSDMCARFQTWAGCMYGLGTPSSAKNSTTEGKKGCFQRKNKNVCIVDVMLRHVCCVVEGGTLSRLQNCCRNFNVNYFPITEYY
jgi:hypothetical protein